LTTKQFKLKPGLSTVPTLVRLQEDQKGKIAKIAIRKNLTISDVIRQMIEHCLDDMTEKEQKNEE